LYYSSTIVISETVFRENTNFCALYSLVLSVILLLVKISTSVAMDSTDYKWVTSWACSIQGPYPIGTAAVQPQLRFVLPGPSFKARDQTFRLTVRPDLWAKLTRLRFSNSVSNKPLVLDGVFVGVQEQGASITHGTNYPVFFDGTQQVVVPPGKAVWSDPVSLRFVDENDLLALLGRKLLVSFHVQGESGEISWQSEALTTSYISRPDSGSIGSDEDGLRFTEGTTSWYFLDALDMFAPSDSELIVAFGDSITNGTGSTLNGDDRWTDILSRRLHGAYGPKIAVVNAGIGGNQVLGPAEYSSASPFPGGPAAVQRLERDILSLSGVSAMIWSEGINDLVSGDAAPGAIIAAMKIGTMKIRAHLPGIRIFLGTLTTALGSDGPYGTMEVDRKR
jgi:hypothetical protein